MIKFLRDLCTKNQKTWLLLRVVLFVIIALVLCTRTSPAAANLVINGDFESGATGWSGGVIHTTHHGGQHSLYVEDTSVTESITAMTVDAIPISPDSKYLFQVWIHGTVQWEDVEVGIYQYDANDRYISGANQMFDLMIWDEWILFKEIIEDLHPQATGVRIVLRPANWTQDGSQTGSAWFDDVSFDPYDGNLVENGGFENGMEGWEGSGKITSGHSHSGTWSLEINDADQNATSEEYTDYIPVLKDRTYLLQFWANGTKEDQVIEFVISPFYINDQNILVRAGENMKVSFSVGPKWTHFSQLIQGFKPDAEGIKIYLHPVAYTRDGSTTGTAYFDDVYFGLHDGEYLANGGFEYGRTDWEGSNFQIVGDTVHSGSKALLMDGSTASIMSVAPDPTPDLWAQSQELIPIQQDSPYLLQAWAHGTMKGQSVAIVVKQFDGSKQYLRYADIYDSLPVNSSWSQYQKIIHSFHQDAVYIQIHLSPATWAVGDGDERHIWFDDVMFIPYKDNLIENGNFERGKTGWLEGDLTSPAHDGSHALKIEDLSKTANAEIYMEDLIPIERNGTYTFATWYLTATSEPIQMSIDQFDANGEWISGNNMNYSAPGTAGEWACTQSTVSDFHPEAVSIRTYLRPDRWTSAGEKEGIAIFDQIVFRYEERPEEGFWLNGTGDVRVWWSPPDQKIQRGLILQDTAPTASSVQISAAGGESESFQLVLVPTNDAILYASSVTSLTGPTTITADHVTLREVAYVPIERPTDYWDFTGCEMPDPLPSLGRVNLHTGEQQPIWITVEVPPGTPAGIYRGQVTLEIGKERELTVPIELKVWDFDLPQEHHLRTAFGLDLSGIDEYHNLGGDSDRKREVFRLYLEDFAEHRISPYDPIGEDWYDLLFYNLNWVEGNFVTDSDPTHGTALQVRDDNSGDGTVSYTRSTVPIPIDLTMNYELSWDVKTGGTRNHAGTDYAIVIEQFDANDQWISGMNVGIVESTGTLDTWDSESRRVLSSDWHSDVSYVQIYLFARSYRIGDATGTTWFDNLSFSIEGTPTNLVQNPGFDPVAPKDLEVHLIETERFDNAAKYAFSSGLDSLRIKLPYFGVITGSSGVIKPSLLEYPWGTTEYREAYPNVVRAIADHLRSNGWLDESYVYWVDEPDPAWLGDIDYGTDILKSGASDLNHLIVANTLFDATDLADHVDIWTVDTLFYDPAWGAGFKGNGKDVWWYVCSSPRDPFANFFIDYPGIDIRSYFWSAWKYNVQGVLYWKVNYWNPTDPSGSTDPWRDAGSYDSNLKDWFGNGDGRLLYPPRDWASASGPLIEKPVPSIRWELIRESLEDYEYFWMLRDAKDRLKAMNPSDPLVTQAEHLLNIPEDIIASLTEYESDSKVYNEYREQVANTLVKILAKSPVPTPTHTSIATASPTPTLSTITPSITPSPTPTSTATPTLVTITPSSTVSPLPTATPRIVTITPSVTPSFTPTPTATPKITTATPTAIPFFLDVPPDHWAHEDIQTLYEGGYVEGCNPEGFEYCPDVGLQRDQASVLVVRGTNGPSYYPDEPNAQPYADVLLGLWHTKWIAKLNEQGYSAGCGENERRESIYCPYQYLTRAELAVFTLRMLLGPDYTPPPLTESREAIFADISNVENGQWYPKWIYAAYDFQLVQDCEDETNRMDDLFRPLEIATRAEMACMMRKALGLP